MYWHLVEAAGPLRPPFAARHLPRAVRGGCFSSSSLGSPPPFPKRRVSAGDPAMTVDADADSKPENRQSAAQPFQAQPFQADVAKLLQLMVHSVYSDKSVFLRELIANAADACERLRYEAIPEAKLLGDRVKPPNQLTAGADQKRLTVEDNGIGMSRDEMAEALGTIARSGTKAFLDRIEAKEPDHETALIGRFGVGFYSAFMVAERLEVVSRRAGADTAWLWSSDGKGTFAISPVALADAPARGTRVVLHLMDDAKT